MIRSKCIALLASASALSVACSAHAQTVPANLETPAASSDPGGDDAVGDQPDIVVTGSRVVNGNQAPTPVTTITTEALLETTPSNLPDALNRLPQFAGQPGGRNVDNPGSNSVGNFLNLRRIGPQRNLILFDGTRVPPTSAFGTGSGAVNVNVLPQLLIQRVEVVTGGASAVYGSDAVSGVVNFVLDKEFSGLKTVAQAGISTFGDDESWRVGAAGGFELFDGRGHFEASFDHYDSKGIAFNESRPPSDYAATGAGTAANPFAVTTHARSLLGSRGGYVISGPPGALGMVFNSNGVATPFTHGTASGTASTESGGDGTTFNQNQILAPLRTNQAFARFDYSLSDSVNAYVQGSYNDSYAKYTYFPNFFFAARILSGNPYIPATIQAAMTAAGAQFITVARVNDRRDGLPGITPEIAANNIYAKAGVNGSFLKDFQWDFNYTYGRSTEKVTNNENVNIERASAALDAVTDPVSGRVVCQVSLTPSASRFPGCQPINIFGPTAPTLSAYDYISNDTSFTSHYVMHDFNFSVTGTPFSTWAGPVKMALSAEYRKLSLSNDSTAQPTDRPNCTDLRANCNPAGLTYATQLTASTRSSETVKEIAGEILIPLLSGVSMFKAVEVNAAVRYTDYRTSGTATTWKVGLNWEMTDDLRIRATRSRDIRAPTLQDLFAPTSSQPTGFNDLHTTTSGALPIVSQGNPNLTPEIGNTFTAGFVYQPSWLRNFSLAVDFYDIKLSNAIVSVAPTTTIVQQECEASNGTSPYCALIERPLPFSNRTPANYPTRIFSQGVNAAKIHTHGVDVEANYQADLNNAGQLGIRAILSYQPSLTTQTLVTQPPTQAAGIQGLSKWRVNLGIDWQLQDLGVAIQERWQSGQHPYDPRTTFYTLPEIPAYAYTDVTLTYKLRLGEHEVTPFLTVENLFNKKPPLVPQTSVLNYPTAQGFDVIGRYFTLGIRGRF